MCTWRSKSNLSTQRLPARLLDIIHKTIHTLHDVQASFIEARKRFCNLDKGTEKEMLLLTLPCVETACQFQPNWFSCLF